MDSENDVLKEVENEVKKALEEEAKSAEGKGAAKKTGSAESKNTENGFFKRLFANKYFKRLAIPGAVVIIGVLMLIFMPWSTPPEDEIVIETPDNGDDMLVAPTPDFEVDFDIPERTPRPDPTPMPEIVIANPLTGESLDEDVSHIRPWAISIGNTADALPQKGIGEADILCEYYIEGATRFMAIYQDISDLEVVGGMRSLRTSSMEFAGGFDAIFAHWMGRTYDGREVHGNPVTRVGTIDGSSVGYREPGPKKLEHRAMASGEAFLEGLPGTYRTEHESGFSQTLLFKEDGTPEGGNRARRVEVPFFRNGKTTTFRYNAVHNDYDVVQYNIELFDGHSEEYLTFTNIIVMQTEMKTGYNSYGHTFIKTTGEGSGYFICGGSYVEIKWEREDLDDPYSFYLTDGTPLELGIGKTYICVISRSATPTFS